MKSLLIVMLAAGAVFAQDKPVETKAIEPANEPAKEAEIIQVKTLTGDSFDRLVKLLKVFNVQMTADNQMRTILVYAPKDVVTQIRHVVEQLDRPGSEAALGKNVDLTLTLLRCSTKPPATPATPLPPDIEAVAKQLRAATQYKNVEIWDVMPMRLQEGKVTSEKISLPMPNMGGNLAMGTVMLYPRSIYQREQAHYVRFDSVKIDLSVPYRVGPATNVMSVGLDTSGDFMEGQKTVVGKISGPGDDEAVFAVIALKVLD